MKQFTITAFLLISLRGFSQQPVFATISGGDLYSLNLLNCTSHFVGSTGYGFGDIAFTSDGRLWGIINYQLYQIDTTTAVATLVGNTVIGGICLVGLDDSTLLMDSGTDLYGVRTSDASTYFIGNIGYGASGDLTWYDNDLYMASGQNLVRITLNSTNTSIVNVVVANTSTYPMPTVMGTVTISLPGSDNRLIWFDNTDALKVCQFDGSTTPLCASIMPSTPPGAASIRLPVQFPEPVDCMEEGPNSISHHQDAFISVSPNPVSANGQLDIKLGNKITGELTITLSDMRGVPVYAETKAAFQNGIAIELQKANLCPGTYVLEICSGEKRQHFLIVVNE